MKCADSEKLAVLWTKACPTVAGYVSSVIPDFHQAEDVLHQVAVIVVRKFDDYDQTKPFTPWALGVAKREVLKHRRNFATDRHVFAEDLLDVITAVYQEHADVLEERRRALHECLGKIEGRGRKALKLRYVEGLKPQGVAERLQVSAAAARMLLSRVRNVLRQCIQRHMNRATTS